MISPIRKPRPRRDGGHWQIIYMDLMTIMMVYFVILWSAEQSSKDSDLTGISPTIGDQTVRMIHLPGDVLFASGQSQLSSEGRAVFSRLFGDDPEATLNFDQGGLARRQLVIHGHTDSVGDKDENFLLGFERAFAVYKEIRTFGDEVPDHVIICTHADNSPAQPIPEFAGTLTAEEIAVIREARARNRRITIEDQIVNTRDPDQDPPGTAATQ
ncbi:MAG: flagellar motor protein MotB [Myxococcota bacterium]